MREFWIKSAMRRWKRLAFVNQRLLGAARINDWQELDKSANISWVQKPYVRS